jgi:signal peptidase
MDTLFKTLYYAFVAVLIAFGLLLGASYIGVGSIEVKIVQSGSMEPAIKTGSIVIIKPTDDYNVGDVVTFGKDTRDEVPTTHRIIEERIVSGQAQYIVKGDANDDRDPQEVRERDIIGKVMLSVPYLGYILDFARKPLGFVLLIGVPALVVVLDEASSIWGEVKKMRGKKKEEERTADENQNNTTE